MKKFINFSNLSEQAKIGLNLSLLQTFFYGAWVFVCYGTVYLQSLGFPASTIGTLIAVNSAIGIFSSIFWGMLSDKINSVKKTLIISSCGLLLFYSLTPLLPVDAPYSVALFFFYYSFVNIFKSSAPMLLDNMSIRTATSVHLNYGFSRSLGSISFAVLSLVVVGIIEKFGIESTFYIYGMFSVPILIMLFLAYDPVVPHAKPAEKHKKPKLDVKPLFKNYYFITFLIFAALFTCATSGDYSFLSYYMEAIGISPNNLGTFLAIRAFCEVPLLVTIIKIRKKVKLKYLILFAASMMACASLLLGVFVTNLPTMLISGATFGIGNGVFIGSAAVYLLKLAPDNLKASAQSMYVATTATAGIIGNLVGGYLFELMGARPFYVAVSGMFVFAIIIFIVTLNVKKSIPNPADQLN